MNDIPRISTSPIANLSISKALYGNEKDKSDEKNNGLDRTVSAKNSFMGRLMSRVLSSPPFKAGQAIKQMFYASIGHLLKPGAFSAIFENGLNHLRNEKPLTTRAVNVPPESLGSWHELETMQSTLADLKDELKSTHEKNAKNVNISMSDLNDTASMAALKVGYPKEAELKSKVQEQEKNVANFEKRLSAQKHVPAFPIKPRPPAKPEVVKTVEQRSNYYVPNNTDSDLGTRSRARMHDSSTSPVRAELNPKDIAANTATNIHSPTNAASAEHAVENSSPKVTAQQINTKFDFNAVKQADPNNFIQKRKIN